MERGRYRVLSHLRFQRALRKYGPAYTFINLCDAGRQVACPASAPDWTVQGLGLSPQATDVLLMFRLISLAHSTWEGGTLG